jgi:hypothetical protein
MQKLAVTEINDVAEIEPAIFEIAVTLQDGRKAMLRMNGPAFNQLVAKCQDCMNSGDTRA